MEWKIQTLKANQGPITTNAHTKRWRQGLRDWRVRKVTYKGWLLETELRKRNHMERDMLKQTPRDGRNHSEIQNRERSTEEEGIRERHVGPWVFFLKVDVLGWFPLTVPLLNKIFHATKVRPWSLILESQGEMWRTGKALVPDPLHILRFQVGDVSPIFQRLGVKSPSEKKKDDW